MIALYETGDDAKARTVFFTYDGEKLQETGSLQADIRRCQYSDPGCGTGGKVGAFGKIKYYCDYRGSMLI
mgnify:CR=1 FL=1